VAARLERSGSLGPDAEVHCAGTDLLRAASLMRGRERMIIIDATLSEPPGVEVLAHGQLHGQATGGAHTLDPVAALELLRAVDPEIAVAETFWILVGVSSVRLGKGLSPAVEALVPEVIRRCVAIALPGAPAHA
jgi:hydrogenase maturation protease